MKNKLKDWWTHPPILEKMNNVVGWYDYSYDDFLLSYTHYICYLVNAELLEYSQNFVEQFKSKFNSDSFLFGTTDYIQGAKDLHFVENLDFGRIRIMVETIEDNNIEYAVLFPGIYFNYELLGERYYESDKSCKRMIYSHYSWYKLKSHSNALIKKQIKRNVDTITEVATSYFIDLAEWDTYPSLKNVLRQNQFRHGIDAGF